MRMHIELMGRFNMAQIIGQHHREVEELGSALVHS